MNETIADEQHARAVDKISADVRSFHNRKVPFRVYHGSTNSTRHANFDRDAIVDVSSLNRVLHVNEETKTVIVEPNVPMDLLVHETKKFGLLPPVVMEFPGITVGGGFVGTAGESSSFKYGFFDRTVNWAEVVLADGEVVKASKAKHQDLFEGLAGSFGTLGVLTLVEIQLISIKSYVELTYYPVTSIEASISKLRQETLKDENDYVDGILFAKTSGAIISGRLTDKCPKLSMIQRFSRAWDPWFYLHAERIASKKASSTEIVPIEDYLFRYDRGAFWTGRYAFKYFWTPFNRITRFLLNYFMHTRVMYHALHASGHTDRYIIQDLALPAANFVEFIRYVDFKFGLYPLWLCPLPPNTRGSMAHPRSLATTAQSKSDQYINVGVWGPYPSSEDGYVAANRDLEAKLSALGGLKWLYARCFYTEDEFWQIYDENRYRALREKYRATSLPTVFDKIRDRPESRNQRFGYGEPGLKGMTKRVLLSTRLMRGFYGIYKAIRGGDYLLAKKKN
ncbi:hypothetical protein BDV96DRAFT_651146 [Lophiotrema nucula]|uniref:Delta(24)-sterol reductase n=1 Tax=Lophiotrema nucula TaxID=690887 RepID=A0A6A5YTQ3_9PLEO|nr:hypothetical protein BDV96DRAFT_651146 [Lophiotrema nucula]